MKKNIFFTALFSLALMSLGGNATAQYSNNDEYTSSAEEPWDINQIIQDLSMDEQEAFNKYMSDLEYALQKATENTVNTDVQDAEKLSVFVNNMKQAVDEVNNTNSTFLQALVDKKLEHLIFSSDKIDDFIDQVNTRLALVQAEQAGLEESALEDLE